MNFKERPQSSQSSKHVNGGIKKMEVVTNVKEKLINFYNKYKVMFIVTIIIGMFAHLFMLTNKLPNHDDIESIFSKGLTVEIGRWGLDVIKYIFPSYSMPWFNGIVMIVLIALSACFVVKILNLDSKVKQCLIGAIMVTYASVICTLAYTFTANAYGVAILLSVLCVYFAIKPKKTSNVILSVLCLILSLSIYQAYISLTATLFIIVLIKDCLNKNKKAKEVLLKGLRFFGILIIGVFLYLASVVIINYATGTSLTQYQGASEIGDISVFSVLQGIVSAYLTIPRLVLRNYYGISAGIILKIGHVISFIVIAIISIILLKKIFKLSKKKSLLFIILVILLPLCMNLMYLISSKVEIHSLMIYGNIFWLILPLVLIEELPKTKFSNCVNNIIIITLVIMTYKYITYANESYFQLKLSYENTQSFYTTLVTRIESIPGFDKDTKIAFLGFYGGELLYHNSNSFPNMDSFTGILSNYEMITAYSKENFIKNYIGVDFNYATEEEINNLKTKNEVQEMELYPYDNSIKKIDDIIVVKFSD